MSEKLQRTLDLNLGKKTGFYFPMPERATASGRGRASSQVYDCGRCKRWENCKTPEMPIQIGDQYDGLVVVVSTTTKEEDNKGRPLLGEAVKEFRSKCVQHGYNLIKKAAVMAAIPCYKSGKISETVLKCCRPKLHERLKELRPKLIIGLGAEACQMILPEGINKQSILALRGRFIPIYEQECILFPTFDPHQLKASFYKTTLRWDAEKAIARYGDKLHLRRFIQEDLERRRILDGIEIMEVDDMTVLTDLFAGLNIIKAFALDYETTGLKPYDDYFHVRYVGFGTAKKAWWVHLPTMAQKYGPDWMDWFSKQMFKLLHNPNVLKVIQNAKYEDLASRYYFKTRCIINHFCTMLATHIVDQRQGCSGLDFQNLVRFGIPPYSGAVKRFLEADKGEKANKIDECHKEEVGQYLGLDVITTFHNYLVLDGVLLNQKDWPEVRACYEFFRDGHEAFANMSERGIPMDEEGISDMKSELTERQLDILDQIGNLEEVQEFEKTL